MGWAKPNELLIRPFEAAIELFSKRHNMMRLRHIAKLAADMAMLAPAGAKCFSGLGDEPIPSDRMSDLVIH